MTTVFRTPAGAVMRQTSLDELRARASGSGSALMCRHPDIDAEAPRDPEYPDRRCVLDQGQPQNCDQTAGFAALGERITDKTKCPYWKPMRGVDPIGLSPVETLAVLDRLQGDATKALEQMVAGVEKFSRAAQRYQDGDITEKGMLKAADALAQAMKQGRAARATLMAPLTLPIEEVSPD